MKHILILGNTQVEGYKVKKKKKQQKNNKKKRHFFQNFTIKTME
jgi:hypothetical protein